MSPETQSPELYSGLSGGRVLDVATGRGGFVAELIDQLGDYDEIVGIDIDDSMAEAFAEAFKAYPGVTFEVVDAMAMPYADASFDTVSISGSLHHLGDPEQGLREMLRVLKPGGRLIVVEMYRDGQTETQQTHVLLHHWWAALDRLRGVPHRETYNRSQILDIVDALQLADVSVDDDTLRPSDPRDKAQLARLEPGIDNYLEYAAGHGDLLAEAEQLRERMRRVGFHLASVLVVVGQKPGIH